MEKQIRNAGKRMAAKDAAKGRHLPSLLKQSNHAKQNAKDNKQALRTMQAGPATLESGTFKTIEVVDGIAKFYIVIPCSPGQPDRKLPLYLVAENEFGGPENGVWQCQECTKIHYTRKAWAKHAGMISNIMGNCPGG